MDGLGAGFGEGFLRGTYLTRGLGIITSIWFYDYGLGVSWAFNHLHIYVDTFVWEVVKRKESKCKRPKLSSHPHFPHDYLSRSSQM